MVSGPPEKSPEGPKISDPPFMPYFFSSPLQQDDPGKRKCLVWGKSQLSNPLLLIKLKLPILLLLLVLLLLSLLNISQVKQLSSSLSTFSISKWSYPQILIYNHQKLYVHLQSTHHTAVDFKTNPKYHCAKFIDFLQRNNTRASTSLLHLQESPRCHQVLQVVRFYRSLWNISKKLIW